MADRISTLPDPIICHILSFLPTEQAIAASVLSKRWIPLWRVIPTLKCDFISYHQKKDSYFRFVRLVYTAIVLRGGEQPFEEFILDCQTSLCDPSTVNSWVMAVTQRKIEHLSLTLHKTINMSFGVFKSTTLVSLKLHYFSLNSFSSVSFPSLKILHLKILHFQKREYLAEILSACPILEVLVMRDLKVGDNSIVTYMPALYLPKLVEVDISDNASVFFPLQSFHNVRCLRANLDEKLLNNLNLSTHNFSNLTSMKLELWEYHYSWNWLIELLHYCPHLQDLEIFQRYGYGKGSLDDKKWVDLPQSVPECLLSALKSFRLSSYEGAKCELQFTRFIIQNARVLRKVTICNIQLPSPKNLLQKINHLSSCPRGSITCELYFE